MDILAPIFELIAIIGILAKLTALGRRIDRLERRSREKAEETRADFWSRYEKTKPK